MSDIRNASKLREHWALPDMKPSAMVPFPAKPQMEVVPATKAPTAGDTGDSRPASQEWRPVQPGYQMNPPSLTPGVERSVDLRPSAAVRPSPAPVQPAPVQSPGAVPLAPREVRIELPPRGRSSLEVSPREAYPG
ncbi:MAG: hypothetical protein R3E68_12640 [Burkholderiaceae bacterium]